MFEALHVGGGVLSYGIPEFRLPKAIVQNEVAYIQKLGVDLRLGNFVGRIHTIPELMKDGGYDAVFIGSGAGLPQFTGCSGENLGGIYSANEFLIRVNLMKAFHFPDYDTPIRDRQTRSRHRRRKRSHGLCKMQYALGAEVCLLYRRSRAELPARHEEVSRTRKKKAWSASSLVHQSSFTVTKAAGSKHEMHSDGLTEPDAKGRRRALKKSQAPSSQWTLTQSSLPSVKHQTQSSANNRRLTKRPKTRNNMR